MLQEIEKIFALLGPDGWGGQLWHGTRITIELALASLILGLVAGAGLALAKLSRFKIIKYLADAYTIIIRGTPEFLILLLVYYGSNRAVNYLLSLIGLQFNLEIPQFLAAVLGLAFIYAAYASEVFVGAYRAVAKGQIEAGQVIGLSRWQLFYRIRVPLLWRFALPGLGNLWLSMIKDTSLAAVLAMNDLLRVAKVAGEAENRNLLFFVFTGIIYLLMTAISDYFLRKVERHSRRFMASQTPTKKPKLKKPPKAAANTPTNLMTGEA
ncbi:MAG: ABC transporter permease subunit [Candidatus Symbiobacter sp.]|nr:ABC transporter permease subunit [Candidatus Symbiobacter sp.]